MAQSACQEDASSTITLEQEEHEACAEGEGAVFIEEDGTKLCVTSQKIIEVGFDCPPDDVGLQSFGLLAICGGGNTSIPAGERIVFDFSDALRRDLEVAYPQLIPRGACADTLCAGHAICLSDDSCELVTSMTSARFMCAEGVCELSPVEGSMCDEQCDTTCPTDETMWACGEDGGRYGRACTAACYGVAVAIEESACPAPPEARVEPCIIDCDATCGEREEKWFCSTDGRSYCSACEVQCTGHAVADRLQCDGALPPDQRGM